MPIFQTIHSFSGVNSFLSNFDPTPFWWNGYRYNGNEIFYQAHKSKDPVVHQRIREATSAKHSKMLGRGIELRDDWESIKQRVMKRGLILKFTQNSQLYSSLLATEDAVLIEGNTWHDNYWGDCTCGQNECKISGENHLGLLLMEIRVTLPALMLMS